MSLPSFLEIFVAGICFRAGTWIFNFTVKRIIWLCRKLYWGDLATVDFTWEDL